MIDLRPTLEMGMILNLANSQLQKADITFFIQARLPSAYDKSYSIIEIVKNNKLVDVALADANDHNDRAAASTMTILSLAKGDTVLVRAGAYYSGHYLETSQYTRMSFSGFKLA